MNDIQPHADYGPLFTSLWRDSLPGAVAEFGVYRGGTCRQLAAMTGRTVYAFDTFRGLPAEDFEPTIDLDQPGAFHPGPIARELFAGCPNIIPVAGRFATTLPTVHKLVLFALVYIDCDYAASCTQVLNWIPDHLLSGSIIVFDDYASHPGIRGAVDEFSGHWGLPITQWGNGAYITWK